MILSYKQAAQKNLELCQELECKNTEITELRAAIEVLARKAASISIYYSPWRCPSTREFHRCRASHRNIRGRACAECIMKHARQQARANIKKRKSRRGVR
jgi:hypothetical protein